MKGRTTDGSSGYCSGTCGYHRVVSTPSSTRQLFAARCGGVDAPSIARQDRIAAECRTPASATPCRPTTRGYSCRSFRHSYRRSGLARPVGERNCLPLLPKQPAARARNICARSRFLHHRIYVFCLPVGAHRVLFTEFARPIDIRTSLRCFQRLTGALPTAAAPMQGTSCNINSSTPAARAHCVGRALPAGALARSCARTRRVDSPVSHAAHWLALPATELLCR